ncbi:MAG: ribonuclease H family protein [Clostridium sp.]|nr:ribonuclease H family protein [Clostridium sp.]
MADKYYAVKVGLETGIFDTWEACRASVHGYSGAEYKSFKTREEALAYLGAEENSFEGGALKEIKINGISTDAQEEVLKLMEADSHYTPKNVSEKANCVKIYVDGSYNKLTEEFSYGMVALTGDGEEKFSGKFQDKELASMHNVAGEIKGAEAAMRYALDKGLEEIEIYHDYEGIAKWCLGEWKTNKEGTKAYKEFYDKVSGQVKIKFVKVAGHSNDKYNDMADELAKKALGLRANKEGKVQNKA